MKTAFASLLLVTFALWLRPVRADDYSFNPLAVKRDPFQPPEDQRGKEVAELNRYNIAEMTLVAIMTGLGPAQAMIVLPNAKTHIVQVGDSIGRQNGRITRITANEVVIRESFKDFRGTVKETTTSMVLAE